MSLGPLQQAIGALLCEADAIEAFARDPQGWARGRGLAASDVRILAGIRPPAMQAFHDIHERDRRSTLEAIFPLTLERIGPSPVRAYFDEHPYGDDLFLAEALRFAAFLGKKGAEEGRAVLAAYEAARFQLLADAPFEALAPTTVDLTKARLAPGLRVVASRVDIPALEEDPRSEPTARHGAALLRRDADGVVATWVEGSAADLLAAYARRDIHALRSHTQTSEGRSAAVHLAQEGVLR